MNIKKFISNPLKVLAPVVAASVMATNPVMADETCMSPYMVKDVTKRITLVSQMIVNTFGPVV